MFEHLIPYLKNYQPCLVFAEDVDQISEGNRDSAMNDLLNQLDGNELKNVDVTFIFTTNSQDKIHPGMRRPGRIDQLVHFDYCDKNSIQKIFQLYAEGFKGAENINYEEAANIIPEDMKLQGAVIAQIAKKATEFAEKLYDGVIDIERFRDAYAIMEDHIKYMRSQQVIERTAEELFGEVIARSFRKAYPNMGIGDGQDFTQGKF